MIATLAAVGYRSADLIASQGTILDLVDLDRSNIWCGAPARPARKPSKLFGPIGWAGIVLARNGGGCILILLVFALLLAPALLVGRQIIPGDWLLYAVLTSFAGVLILGCVLSAGLASLSTFEWGLNQLLRLRLAGRLDPATAHRARLQELITFADLDRAGCPPLRVVAADITTRELRLFSHATTPHMSVARAVSASVCLPVIFRPRDIGGRLHLDGGLVSNLPSWAFDAERALDRDAWTAVVQVVKAGRLWGLGILKGAVLTGIFGSGLLNVRNVDRLRAVRLKVGLKLLEFDPGLAAACAAVEDAKATSLEKLVYHLRKVPELMNDVCERIQVRAQRTLNLVLRTEGRPEFVGRIRVSIFARPRDDGSSLTAEFQAGFEDAPDERIRLPVNGSIVGHALRDGEPLYLERSDPSWSPYLSRPQDRWLRKLVSPDISWVLCVPYIKLDDGIELVATIDSNSALEVEADLVDITMASLSDEVVAMLGSYVPKEAFSDGGT
ncbi:MULTISPECIES: patatin-like phospholipase family protein [unclassified Sphingobium]|uniref:patatin-like phospholipase family protein n=1 Tax=unclassified Sphingobium TaxID=2611147 RepID=UPI00222558BF|nr:MULTISPECIES: patatin-like phospholipase family protein [unclassified Sphingobium]MCW2395775.1 NTE family protein [Sphingobium sp. B8D3B]MCW2419290.1 NTE family protein [Sphingobium sp. B8D3C]